MLELEEGTLQVRLVDYEENVWHEFEFDVQDTDEGLRLHSHMHSFGHMPEYPPIAEERICIN